MKNNTDIQPATPESVWVALRELAASQAETDRQMKETDRKIDKVRETLGSWANKHERMVEDTDRQMKDTDRKIDKVRETLGSWANNHGCFAEEYFFNSFEKGKQNFFGEKFDDIRKNLKGTETNDEFDIVMLNGSSVGLVEVKFKAHKNDIPKTLNKVYTFRENFPKYTRHKVYLGLASLSFYPELEEECIRQGIAIIKQVGDTVVINDKHLKAF